MVFAHQKQSEYSNRDTSDYSRDVFRITRVYKNIALALLSFLIQPDASISSSPIGWRDNASCEFPAQVKIFNFRKRRDWGEYLTFVAIASLNLHHPTQILVYSCLCIDFVCNLQIIEFAFGVHTPSHFLLCITLW